jgi:hypothetical protein
MSTARTERLAKIDRLIDYLARLRGEFPDPEASWGSLIEFADLTEEIARLSRAITERTDEGERAGSHRASRLRPAGTARGPQKGGLVRV